MGAYDHLSDTDPRFIEWEKKMNDRNVYGQNTSNNQDELKNGPPVIGHSNSSTSGGNIIWPYNDHYPYTYPGITTGTSFTLPATSWVSVDKAENGFIVKKDGKTFVCKTAEEIVEFLKD